MLRAPQFYPDPTAVSYEVWQQGTALSNALGQDTHSHQTGIRTARERCLCQPQAEMGSDAGYGAHRCTLGSVVKMHKPKVPTGLSHKGHGVGTGSPPYPVMDSQHHRRTASTSPMLVNRAERGKPVSLLPQGREGERKANGWRCGSGGGKKRRPPRSGTETGCHMTRRASELTSLRWLGTRTTEESRVCA